LRGEREKKIEGERVSSEKMGDGKTAKACSRFGHERSEVARRAEGAGGAPESTWKMVSHEGTKTRRRDVECWMGLGCGREGLGAWKDAGTVGQWIEF
jgi:hypothetical protein